MHFWAFVTGTDSFGGGGVEPRKSPLKLPCFGQPLNIYSACE